MIIRPAMATDLPRLSDLLQASITYQQQLSPFFALVSHIDWGHFTQTKLQNPHERVFVAEQDAQLVGYIDVQVPSASRHRFLRSIMRCLLAWSAPPSIVRPRHVGWIEDCYVLPQVRQQGVGKALVHVGLTWLQGQSVRRVELAVLAANRGGMAFWEKQGFAPLRLLMFMDLNGHL